MVDFPLVWDSTMANSLRSCHRQFELAHLQDYKSKIPNVNLHAGAAFARGLQVTRMAYYAEGRSPEDAIALGIGALIEFYGDFDPGESTKTCERMAGALEYYFSQYPLPDDPAQVLSIPGKGPAVEFSFAIPLPIKHPISDEPLIFAGRFDAVVEFASGIYALDEKTTGSLGSSWGRQWEMRAQFCGYAWAMREHGLPPAGTIVAGVSILKQKYEQQRVIVSQGDYKIDDWYEDTLGEILEARDRFMGRGKWKKNWGESCNVYGGCAFREVCQQRDPVPWLETHFERRKWDPLER